MRRIFGLLAAVVLAVISGLHFLWSTGTSWPAREPGTISGNISGDGNMPGPLACVSVGALLALASGFVGGLFQNHWIGRTGRVVVGMVLAIRGTAGVTGNTSRLVGRPTSADFDRLDRNRFGPLCLVLALMIVLSRPRLDN